MPLNPEAVGSKGEPVEVGWTSKDCLLYAVGIGAGTGELAFTTENTNGVEQLVFPTFPVVIGWGKGSPMGSIGTFNPALLVHGQQAVTLHRPIPVEGTATLQSEIVAMYDKGKAAVVVTETTATLGGEPLYSNRSSVFIRGEGGWGGDRGPSGPQNVPPDRAPDHQVTYQTSPDQALVYRLSGDRNPLHSDPSFAAMGGFDRPILHGLCSYGFTGRALLHTLCGSDPARFAHIEARFASPVFPGEALTVSMWEVDGGDALFVTAAGDRVVIDQGLLRRT
jgi:acyl dehydratase